MEPCKEIVLTQDLRDLCSRSNNVSYLCSFMTCFLTFLIRFQREILSLEPRALMRKQILKLSNILGKKKI